VVVGVDPKYYRPSEVETLLGDPSKAKQKLGWEPRTTLEQMIQEMVANDLSDTKKHRLLLQQGYQVNATHE
jgi:GDPmannose 4,6-dehydratase